MSDRDPWDHSGDNHAVSLIISNAYRARHGMEPINVHATVDEDIADAILSSDWLAKVKREAAAEALESAELAILRRFQSRVPVMDAPLTLVRLFREQREQVK